MIDDAEWSIRAVLANVLANGVTAKEIPLEADLVDEYALDSLQMISFLLGIEEALDVEIDYENLQLDHLRSLRDFTDFATGLRTQVQ